MYTEMALTARRFALTLAIAGIAAAGSIAIAPAASADDDAPSAVVVQDDDRDDDRDDDARDDDSNGPSTVVHRSGRGGPDAFIVREHGRKPVFFCDVTKSKKHHKTCIDLTGPTRF